MSSVRLPCHKGLARRTHDAQGNSNGNNNGRVRLRPGQIPYVSHDNGKTRYYADRYYMDAPTALLEYQLEEQREKKKDESCNYCDYCGEKRQASDTGSATNKNQSSPARPLFDRAAFINSLDLSAAIIATYTIGDLDFLSESFPALFPDPDGGVPRQHVPTLVLHGHRGWKLPNQRRKGKHEDVMTGPDEWEVEQDEADCDLKPDATKSNEELTKEEDECKEVGYTPLPVKKEAEPNNTPSLKKDTGKCTAAEKENVSSQSPSKEDFESVHPSANHNIKLEAGSTQIKPALTYQGLTLDITSKKKRKRKTKQANEEGFSPRRSPRLSPPKKHAIMSPGKQSRGAERSPSLNQAKKKPSMSSQSPPETQGFEFSPRRSPRLNPALKLKQTIKGSTPMDAIELGSDTEDDECNKAPVDTSGAEKNDGSVHTYHSPPSSPLSSQIQSQPLVEPPLHSRDKQVIPDKPISSIPHEPQLSLDPHATISRKRLKMTPSSTDQSSAAAILARSFGSVPDAKLMKPLNYTGDAGDSTDDDSDDGRYVLKSGTQSTSAVAKEEDVSTDAKTSDVIDVSPASVFGGEVYFTQVLPRWIPPKDYKSLKKTQSKKEAGEPRLETVRGCHHPKFFLLFEKRGSLVVIVSTCNLTPQHAVDASWVQRFMPRSNVNSSDGDIDFGTTQDFGHVLTDLLKKQTDAAEKTGMLPDAFLRRYVEGLSSGGLGDLAKLYLWEASHVHLVSTVPGDYSGHLPKKGVASYLNRPPYRHPALTYGSQRVAYILSRVMDKHHIGVACSTIPRGLDSSANGGMAAVTPWLPPSLLTKTERLVVQPTSMSGTWNRWELEMIAKSYLEPHWTVDKKAAEYNSPVDLIDIVWPTMGHFDSMREKRRALKDKHSNETISKTIEKRNRGCCHVFLSSIAFSQLDRVCVSRMSLFEPSHQPYMKQYDTTSLHFKSFSRMLELTGDKTSQRKKAADLITSSTNDSKEHLTWFMLTNACFSKGAQGRPTPYRPPESDSMSYANFELGVLFCSRILGDRVNDRLYVSDNEFAGGCQCGKGKRWYKDLLKNCDPNKSLTFLDGVKRVHLPIPFHLRPKPYQQDVDSDFMSHTPYLHDIPPGTDACGNMKLTPYGRNAALKSSSASCPNDTR